MNPLSVVILTYNEEANLPDALASLQGLQADVFIVDSFSTDRTRGIAAERGLPVVQHAFEHYGAQRNWAQDNLPLQTDWVLHLDADERLTPELVKEINDVLRTPPNDVNGFMLRKRTYFMGRWIRHGGHYPSFHLRLFRRAKGRCEERLYDQHFLVEGPTRNLRNDYVDVLTSDIGTWTVRHARWAELEAREIVSGAAENRVEADLAGNPIQRRRWQRENIYLRAPPIARAFAYWFYRYFLRLGFLDGIEGLIFHFLQGLWYRVLIDVKILEARRRKETGN